MTRAILEDLQCLSIYKLKQLGLLETLVDTDSPYDETYRSGCLNWIINDIKTNSIGYKVVFNGNSPVSINLNYTLNNEISRDYDLIIDKTICNYGGNRYWFKCKHCYKRVAKLYHYQGYFYCRNCCNLTYEANNYSKRYREMGKAFGSGIVQKLEDHLDKTNRYYYKGRLTKKAKKLNQLRGYQEAHLENFIARNPTLKNQIDILSVF